MNVVFRVDGSSHIGGGHLSRCNSLANELLQNGLKVFFICQETDGDFLQILENKIVIQIPKSQPNNMRLDLDAMESLRVIKQIGQVNWLIVDHYELNETWEKTIKPAVGKIMVIDDSPTRRHECDILLDQNSEKSSEVMYSKIVPKFCTLLLGPRYALLDKEYSRLRKLVDNNTEFKLERILVFFTLGDDQGETLKAMKGIEPLAYPAEVDIVIGTANKFSDQIKKICQINEWRFHQHVNYMPSLLANASLVIGAGGFNSWERCALGVPAIVTTLADNQQSIVEILSKAAAIHPLGWGYNLTSADYANALNNIDAKVLGWFSKNSFNLVNGDGSLNVANKLIELSNGDGN